MASVLPAVAAQCKGEQPNASTALTSASASRSATKVVVDSLSAANDTAVRPCSSWVWVRVRRFDIVVIGGHKGILCVKQRCGRR